jgi:hypothetical protein
MPLGKWEVRFDSALNGILNHQRGHAGALLPVIPGRDDWDVFVKAVREEWRHREWAFTLNPACMVVLYDGVAYYNYRSGAFWNGFAEVVATADIPANVQTEINQRYAVAAKRFDLPIVKGDFVGSSVAHIGIPISMWDGFLRVCEWALWAAGWQEMDAAAWREAMITRLGGQTRLINFLVANRKTAMEFIREMLDARRVLSADRTLTVAGIAQALILRAEYFDEVPETADFLRPDDPESLFADRGRLNWNEQRQTISLHLPPVADDLLPAVWRLAEREQQAASTALEFPINGGAFAKTLRLQRVSNGHEAEQRIVGINGWALYDEARSRFINHERDLLPVSQYTLISRRRLSPQLVGWQQDPEEPSVDIESELADGMPIFLTRLFAESRRPKLRIDDGPWIEFAQRRGVVLRVFCGERSQNATRFSVLSDGRLRTEVWPRPFLEVPLSLVSDDEIPAEFTVFIDGQPASGKWRTFEFDPPNADPKEAERAFCFWHWDPALTSSVPCGNHILHVQSRRLGRLMFGVASDCRFELLPPTEDKLWPSAWGEYFAWVLLSQVQDDASWEEVRIARDAVAMHTKLNLNAVYYNIRKLERHGYLVARGHRYRDFRSRIAFAHTRSGAFQGEYCGLTSALYDLVRKVPPLNLAPAPIEPGRPPKLKVEWAQRDRHDVRNACQIFGIEAAQRLWDQ